MQLSKTVSPLELCNPTPVGLSVPEDMPFPQWVDAVRSISRINASLMFWLGDLLLGGIKNYGDKSKISAQAQAEADYSFDSCMIAIRVCESVPLCRRLQSLSFYHHLEVSKLSAGDQEIWLSTAETNGWSVSNLRQAIRKGQANLDDGSQDGSPQTSWSSAWMDAIRPVKRWENEMPLSERSEDDIKSVMRLIEPASSLLNRLKDELGRRSN